MSNDYDEKLESALEQVIALPLAHTVLYRKRWKEAARRFARRARNHRHNWREITRENLAARRALRACAECLELQADRESGRAHLSGETMSGLMAIVAKGARRVLNGGSYDDIDAAVGRLTR